MEGSEGTGRGVLSKTKQVIGAGLNALHDLFGVDFPPLETDKITNHLVAASIKNQLTFLRRTSLGLDETEDIELSASTVASFACGIPEAPDTTIKEAYPEQYGAVRREIDSLVRGGVLKPVLLKDPDRNGENVHYKVTSEGVLEEFISKSDLN